MKEELRSEDKIENGSWRDSVLENALDAVIGVNADDTILDWNIQAEKIFGWTRREAVGQKMSSLIVPLEFREHHARGMKKFLATGRGPILNKRIEIRALRKSGETFPIELTVTPIPRGNSYLFYSFLRDIGESQATYRRLELQYNVTRILAASSTQAEALERTLEEITLSMGWDVGLYWQTGTRESKSEMELVHCCLNSTDESIESFIDVSRAQNVVRGEGVLGAVWEKGDPEWRTIHPETKPELPRARAALVAGFKKAFWFPIKRKGESGGREKIIAYLEFIGREGPDRDMELVKALDAISDQIIQFLDRLEAVAAVEKSARESQAVNRVKDEFLASLSHELRTPLTAILGFAEVLRDEFDTLSGTEKREYIEGILRNATVQTEMISDLLDVSRIITGKVSFKPKQVSISEIARAVFQNFESTASAKGLDFQFVDHSQNVMVFADPVRIQQVLWNLVSNAIKFTPPEGRVLISLSLEGKRCCIEVQDSGAGIEKEFLPYVFDRFRQEDSSITRRFGGLGLGLAIARHLMEIHGGTIDAFSEGKGTGSRFRVCLPLQNRMAHSLPDARIDQEVIRSSAPISPHLLRGKKILLVEDSPDSRHLIVRLLEKSGALVREAASAADAREILANEIPDLIISDIGMPNESGLEFMSSLRSADDPKLRGVLALALTAYVRSEEKEDIFKAGFHAHVAKPVSREALMRAIAQVLPASE